MDLSEVVRSVLPLVRREAAGRVHVEAALAPAAPVLGSAIAPYQNLMGRVDAAKVQAMIDASKVGEPAPAAAAPAPAAGASAAAVEPLAATIAFDDFAKVDLRVAQVLTAEDVPKAKKIVKLRVSLGSLGERTIFAGIKAAFPDAAVLVGRKIVVVANLAPRQMSFGTSEGMVIAAGEAPHAFLLTPDPGAEPGQRLH